MDFPWRLKAFGQAYREMKYTWSSLAQNRIHLGEYEDPITVSMQVHIDFQTEILFYGIVQHKFDTSIDVLNLQRGNDSAFVTLLRQTRPHF